MGSRGKGGDDGGEVHRVHRRRHRGARAVDHARAGQRRSSPTSRVRISGRSRRTAASRAASSSSSAATTCGTSWRRAAGRAAASSPRPARPSRRRASIVADRVMPAGRALQSAEFVVGSDIKIDGARGAVRLSAAASSTTSTSTCWFGTGIRRIPGVTPRDARRTCRRSMLVDDAARPARSATSSSRTRDERATSARARPRRTEERAAEADEADERATHERRRRVAVARRRARRRSPDARARAPRARCAQKHSSRAISRSTSSCS